MRQGRPTEAPPRASGAHGHWVEISAWIVAFAILLAAQCVPERALVHRGSAQPADVRAPRSRARRQRPARSAATAPVMGSPVRRSTKSHWPDGFTSRKTYSPSSRRRRSIAA